MPNHSRTQEKRPTGNEGLIMIHLPKDEKSGVLIGLAIWDTKEHFMLAQKDMTRALKGINFELLEDAPHKLYFAEPIPEAP